MIKWIFLFLLIGVIFFIIYLKINKIHIDFKSFFHRGFKKIDNTFGLWCFTGKQGKGKTYSCIKMCTDFKKMGYKIITNVKSFKCYNDTIFVNNFKDVIDFVDNNINDNLKEKYIIFYDEIFTILEKNFSINKDIRGFISQLRKRNLILITTAQEWGEINLTFRRYCRYQIDCNMFSLPLTKTAFILNSINDGDNIRWDNDLQDWVAPRLSANFRKCNKYVCDLYDTFETIPVEVTYGRKA